MIRLVIMLFLISMWILFIMLIDRYETIRHFKALNPISYDGEVMDIQSGLLYLRSRYYSAESERFISQDKLSLFNRYAFANSEPILGHDPTGKKTRYKIALKIGMGDFRSRHFSANINAIMGILSGSYLASMVGSVIALASMATAQALHAHIKVSRAIPFSGIHSSFNIAQFVSFGTLTYFNSVFLVKNMVRLGLNRSEAQLSAFEDHLVTTDNLSLFEKERAHFSHDPLIIDDEPLTENQKLWHKFHQDNLYWHSRLDEKGYISIPRCQRPANMSSWRRYAKYNEPLRFLPTIDEDGLFHVEHGASSPIPYS